ncbi:hypothetical protein [Solicola sp. PLA-1-18]|uniref:hypothetical protein n=1 Tax=Solicola sp. PLA-1-18 TaxID=3380532 RepID=UPI003B80B583
MTDEPMNREPVRHRRMTTGGRRLGAGALVLTAALALVACGTDEPEQTRLVGGSTAATTDPDGIELVAPGGPGQPRGELPVPASVDTGNAEQVADAVALTNFVVDTRIDRTPMDGLRRASRWLTDDYAAAVAKPIPASGGAEWIDLADVDGYTTATVTDGDEAEGGKATPTSVLLVRIVSVARHNAAGRVLGVERLGTFVTLTRPDDSGPWAVESITTA